MSLRKFHRIDDRMRIRQNMSKAPCPKRHKDWVTIDAQAPLVVTHSCAGIRSRIRGPNVTHLTLPLVKR